MEKLMAALYTFVTFTTLVEYAQLCHPTGAASSCAGLGVSFCLLLSFSFGFPSYTPTKAPPALRVVVVAPELFDPPLNDFKPLGSADGCGSNGSEGSGGGGLRCGCRCGSLCALPSCECPSNGISDGSGFAGREALYGREEGASGFCLGLDRSICRSFASIIAILSLVLRRMISGL
jgi:hypothetical protein